MGVLISIFSNSYLLLKNVRWQLEKSSLFLEHAKTVVEDSKISLKLDSLDNVRVRAFDISTYYIVWTRWINPLSELESLAFSNMDGQMDGWAENWRAWSHEANLLTKRIVITCYLAHYQISTLWRWLSRSKSDRNTILIASSLSRRARSFFSSFQRETWLQFLSIFLV